MDEGTEARQGCEGVDTSTPPRAWASRHLRGVMNYILPTFLEDGASLDEEAVRLDVHASIAHGFFATIPMSAWFGPHDPRGERFRHVVLDEAAGRLLVQGSVGSTSLEEDIRAIRRCEELGFDFLSVVPRGLAADSSCAQLFEAFVERIGATELPVTLYAASNFRYPSLGPGGQPIELFDRLADLPNVVGLKVSHPIPLGITRQICEVIADRVHVALVNLDFVPVLARDFPLQWSGQWNGEAVQTPERPLAKELLAAAAARDLERVVLVYNEMLPVLEHFYWLQAPWIAAGAHPWQHNKYYSWLTGGNGGVLPSRAVGDRVPVLDGAARRGMRDAFAAAGLQVTDAPDEQFLVGRAAWDRGVRPDTRTLATHGC